MSKTINEEKNTIDLVTDAMFSLSYLDHITKTIFNPKTNEVSLIDFHRDWLRKTGASIRNIPFSLGSFVGYLFCGLLITKENWSNLLPDKCISTLEPIWGLTGVAVLSSDHSDPKLSYFIRRVRNALGHTNFSVQIPQVADLGGNIDKLHDLTKFAFRDVDPRDKNDWFEASLTMRQLEMLIKKFQSIVHQSLRVG